jgi:thiol:disulfide interchange protein/DsbC/DsbD-like thiol-disulfide interchange protein
MRIAPLLASLLALPAFAGGTASPKPPPPPAVDFSSVPASAAVRPPQAGDKQHPVLARLIADRDVAAPGGTVRVGVVLEQQHGWHTYWRSPGDIGMPTTIAWKLPDGATASSFEYPIPQRFEDTGIVSYGYEDQVLLYSTIALPASLPAGTHEIAARVDWLVCEANCIPGGVDLALPLTVGADSGPNTFAALFDHYTKQHPTPASEVKAFTVETKSEPAELLPEKPFKVTIELKPTGSPLGAPPASGTWPTFTPVFNSNEVFLMSTSVSATPGGGLQAVIEGETLALDPAPAKSAFGGLFQVDVDGKTVRTEVLGDVPWAAGAPAVTTADPAVEAPVAPETAAATMPAAQPVSAPMMLLFAFFGGLLLNIMPCVLPVLTLKLYGLVAHGHHEAGERRVAGVAYTAGILVSFWVLAGTVLTLRAVVGDVGWGFQFQYPPYVAALATIVFAFGLSMFGVFEIPAIGADSAANASSRGGNAGHFLTGVFATLLGTPCSAPFLGPAIGFAFSQSTPVVALFFTAVGLGLAFPFLLVAFVPSLFRLLPQPGPWMDTFKQLMGFTLVATTVWLVDVLSAQIGPDATTGFLAFLGVVGFGAWFFGRYGGLAETASRQIGALAVALGIGALGGWQFLDLDFDDAEACEPKLASAEGLDYSEEIPWQPFSDGAVTSLKGKPLFIDFTADWCLTCKVNEKTVLAQDSVRDKMKDCGIVPLQADWTRKNPEITAWLTRFGRAGVPFYVVLPADQAEPIPLPEVITPGLVEDAIGKVCQTSAATPDPKVEPAG